MTVIVEKKEHVGYITLNRPEVLNALDNETLHDFWGLPAIPISRRPRSQHVAPRRSISTTCCAALTSSRSIVHLLPRRVV